MAKPVTHFSKIRRCQSGMTVTGTLCNRMTSGEINCSADELDVTCNSAWIFQPSSIKILAFATTIRALVLVLRMVSLSRSATI
jgi:hypothetical protein